MKKSYIVVLTTVIGLLIMGGWFLTQNTQQMQKAAQTATVTVQMKEDVVEPETITIKKGTTVIFKNEDKVARWPASNLHPTHSIYPEFDPQKPIEPNDSWSFTFNKTGSWKYHDHLIPSIRGIIIITE